MADQGLGQVGVDRRHSSGVGSGMGSATKRPPTGRQGLAAARRPGPPSAAPGGVVDGHDEPLAAAAEHLDRLAGAQHDAEAPAGRQAQTPAAELPRSAPPRRVPRADSTSASGTWNRGTLTPESTCSPLSSTRTRNASVVAANGEQAAARRPRTSTDERRLGGGGEGGDRASGDDEPEATIAIAAPRVMAMVRIDTTRSFSRTRRASSARVGAASVDSLRGCANHAATPATTGRAERGDECGPDARRGGGSVEPALHRERPRQGDGHERRRCRRGGADQTAGRSPLAPRAAPAGGSGR